MPLKASVDSLVGSILLKAEREEAWHSSTGSPFHKDGAMTKKAWFPVDVFLAFLGMATCKSIACEVAPIRILWALALLPLK